VDDGRVFSEIPGAVLSNLDEALTRSWWRSFSFRSTASCATCREHAHESGAGEFTRYVRR